MARKSKPGLLYTSFHIVVHSNFKISPFVSTFLLVVFIAQNKGIRIEEKSKPGLLYIQAFILLEFKHRKADKMRLCTYTADDISTNMQL